MSTSALAPLSAASPVVAASSPLNPSIPTDLYFPIKLNSWVWQHAQKSHTDKNHVWCAVASCPSSQRRISSKRGNTTNLASHLNRHNIYEPTSTSLTTKRTSIRDVLLAQAKAVPACSASLRASLDALIVQFFVTNCIPFNVIDSKSFMTLLSTATGLSYIPPARTSFVTTVDGLYRKMVDTLVADVRANTISITTDAATLANGGSYITVTGHYITSRMEMRDVTLSVQRMTASHTASTSASCWR